MNKSNYFNYIEEKLSTLATRIAVRGKLNILDIHLHSENFYAEFLNEIFGWKLSNLNQFKMNVQGIDLIDNSNQIAVQVSATATKGKIESALGKNLSSYAGYSFKFVSISTSAAELRTKTYKNPHGLQFSPSTDIYDVPALLNVVNNLTTENMRRIYKFIQGEFADENLSKKIESNLATIINVLAKEDWNIEPEEIEISVFEVDRKISFNALNTSRIIIDDYKIHYGRLDSLYTEFNKQGANKSLSVLQTIRRCYTEDMLALSEDALFIKIIESVIDVVQASSNYNPMPYDELELCISILVVDAFIRCKIFKNPEKYNYVVTR